MAGSIGDNSARGLARLLRDWRLAAGVTQDELARLSGISRAAIRDLEQGRSRYPRLASVRALAAALHLDATQVAALLQAAAHPPADRPAAARGSIHAVRILGPLEIIGSSVPVIPSSGTARALLGRLALSAGTPVDRSELVEIVWGSGRPPSPANLLQTHVSRLRRTLLTGGCGSSETIRLVPAGYVLDVAAQRVDAHLFRRLTGRARHLAPLDPVAAFSLLQQALATWRGEPMLDIPQLRDHPLAVGLVEDRLLAALSYADLANQLGWHARAIPVLQELAARHPLHEGLQGRLILALAATGRQASAVNVYDSVRRLLANELGLDPSPELTRYLTMILRQEWIHPPDGTSAAAGCPNFPPSHRWPPVGNRNQRARRHTC